MRITFLEVPFETRVDVEEKDNHHDQYHQFHPFKAQNRGAGGIAPGSGASRGMPEGTAFTEVCWKMTPPVLLQPPHSTVEFTFA
jgi:hypothetical protein